MLGLQLLDANVNLKCQYVPVIAVNQTNGHLSHLISIFIRI